MRVSLSLFAALLLALPAERKQGNPLDHLPPNFEVLTHFGERADISPDNLRVAFMAKSFGLWFLSKERGSRPIKLGQKMSEGAAISKKSLKSPTRRLHSKTPIWHPNPRVWPSQNLMTK